MKKLIFIIFALFFILKSELNAQWEKERQLSNVPSSFTTQENNARCIAAYENFVHVIWVNINSELSYRRSTDNGKTWESVLLLTQKPSSSIGPSIAVSGLNIHVVWTEYKSPKGLYYKNSNDGGLTWGITNFLQPDNNSISLNYSLNASIAVSGSRVHIVWDDNENYSNSKKAIYYIRSMDGGQTWDSVSIFRNKKVGDFYKPSIAVSGSDIHVVWEDSYDAIYYLKITNDGDSWSKFEKITNQSSSNPSIFAYDQFVHIVWEKNEKVSDKEIFHKMSSDGGLTWSIEKKLTDGEGYVKCTKPMVISFEKMLHILYNTSESSGINEINSIKYGLSRDCGLTWNKNVANQKITDGQARWPSIAISESTLHVVYSAFDDNGKTAVFYNRNTSGNIIKINNSILQLTDLDGNVYKTVVIGDQEWMVENLNVSRFSNGDPIPQEQDPSKWENLKTAAWCYYENKTEKGKIYGKLYNWYAVNDPRGLAPEGWHISTLNDWEVLSKYFGGNDVSGGKLKSKTLWSTSGKIITDESLFSALPGGSRDGYGKFNDLGKFARFWTTERRCQILSFENSKLDGYYDHQEYGHSCRCVRNN